MWEDYSKIDAGIRIAVRVLHAHGIETGQSCQGGEGHSYPEPTVDLWSDCKTTGFAAVHALMGYGLPVMSFARNWDILDGEVTGPFWRITFRRTMEDRADDELMFVWGWRRA